MTHFQSHDQTLFLICDKVSENSVKMFIVVKLNQSFFYICFKEEKKPLALCRLLLITHDGGDI